MMLERSWAPFYLNGRSKLPILTDIRQYSSLIRGEVARGDNKYRVEPGVELRFDCGARLFIEKISLCALECAAGGDSAGLESCRHLLQSRFVDL
jgi:hypothetical protein